MRRVCLAALLGACQPIYAPAHVEQLWAEVQNTRGLVAKRAVPVEVVSVQEFAHVFAERERSKAETRLQILAMPGDSTQMDAARRVADRELLANMAAFYDPSRKKIFASPFLQDLAANVVIGPRLAEFLLVVALEQALQDQYIDEKKFTHGDSVDEILAREGLLGADARLTATLWLQSKLSEQKPRVAPPALNKGVIWDPLSNLSETVLEAIAPIYGAVGWDGINQLFAEPPLSASQLFRSAGLVGEYSPLGFKAAINDGCTKEHRFDRLGPIALSYFERGQATDLALHWVGDQVERCVEADGTVRVVWTLAFRHSEDARAVVEKMRARFLADGRSRVRSDPAKDDPNHLTLDRFELPQWPLVAAEGRNVVLVWMSIVAQDRQVAEALRSRALALAPKQQLRATLRTSGFVANEAKSYDACAHAFADAAALGGDWTDHYNAGCCFALAGDSEAAFSELSRVFGSRFAELPALVRDPDLAALHSDARWAKLLNALLLGQKRYQKAVNAELRSLFEEDKREHEKDGSHAEADAARLSRAREILAAKKLLSADDYFHAARIFYRSANSADLAAARALANRAADVDPSFTEASQLSAVAEDRWLLSLGRPQKFGSQHYLRDGVRVLYPVDPAVTDDERAEWDMPPLAETRKRVEAASD